MDITKKLPSVLAFCAGYGGIERGLDLSGFEHRVVAYVEIEAYAIANLVAKMEAGQLPAAPIYSDLKTFPAELFRGKVDLITGGYPCQPFSAAGQRKGADDPRHLWPYIRRHIESIRPFRCFFENVEGHISLGLSTVISDLEEDGYFATWGIFSAEEVGAPHRRKRVYILANSKNDGGGRELRELPRKNAKIGESKKHRKDKTGLFNYAGKDESNELADSIGKGLQGGNKSRKDASEIIARQESAHGSVRQQSGLSDMDGNRGEMWPPEPRLGRVVDGCANRVDRIRLLGNGVVPQTAAQAWLTLTERF